MTALLEKSTTVKEMDGLPYLGNYCPYLRLQQKEMSQKVWMGAEGMMHNGAHFPLCVHTNNARARSEEAVSRRQEKRNQKRKGKGKGRSTVASAVAGSEGGRRRGDGGQEASMPGCASATSSWYHEGRRVQHDDASVSSEND